MRTTSVGLVVLTLLLVLGSAQADFAWLQLDDPPDEDGGDAGVGNEVADVVDLFFSPTYTVAAFRMDLLAMPDPDNYTYVVYLDNTGTGGFFNWRLVYNATGAYLEERSPPDWNYVKDVNLTIDPSTNSVILEVLIADIGGIDDLRVAFRTYEGAPRVFNQAVDRAPNGGTYLIEEETIPNLPLLVLPGFVGGLAGTVFLLRKRLFV